MQQGQINRGSKLGEIIYNFCKKDNINTIFEIGTWNGLGTTKCIFDAIIDSGKKNYFVQSLESNEIFYNQAINNLPKLENFNLILGRIVEIKEILNVDSMGIEFFGKVPYNDLTKWRNEDIENYNKIPNVLNMIPQKIDLAILDGGEFSSFSEFEKIKDRTEYFILDDTNMMKNFKVREIIKNDDNYEIIHDEPSDRNGFLVAKKIK